MRTPAGLLVVLATSLLAAACSGNDPVQPQIVVAGWSWNPSQAGVDPIPVAWTSVAAPSPLPLLPATGCTASGSAQAVANANGTPLFAGISVTCAGGAPVMNPVTWQGGAVTRLPLPATRTQGTALAVAWFGGHSYVAGASGDAYPLPTIWKDGELKTRIPENLLPVWCDAGVITSLVVTSKYAIAAGVVHTLGTAFPDYQGVIWILDPDFTSLDGKLLMPPTAMGSGSLGGSVATTFDGLQFYSTASVSLDGRDKPVFWLDDVAYPISGESFDTAPWGVPTGIALVDTTPYITGFSKPGTLQQPPEPIIWTPKASMVLSTADGSLTGSGEAIVVSTMWAFVAGESLGQDPTDSGRRISVPALWTNGERQDLPGLVAPGGAAVLGSPLHAWWKVPGTTPPADWPWPGGTL